MKKILLVFLLVILTGQQIFAQCSSNISGTFTTCASSCNGSVTFTSTAGTPPYNLVVTGGPSVQYTSSYNWTNVCAGSYHYDITDAALSCHDTGTVVVTAITPTVPPALTIEAYDMIGNPLGNNPTVCELQTIDFNVQVPFINILPNTFTWKKNGVPVLVQNNVPNFFAATYQSANLASGDVITLEVSWPNACISPNPRISQNIQFAVTPNQPPAVTISHNFPTDTICQGNMITFLANAFEAGNPAYMWYLDGSPVANTPIYTTPPTVLTGSHNIWCEITSSEVCDLWDPVYNQWASSNPINIYVNSCSFLMPMSGSLGPLFACGLFYDSPVNYTNNANGLVKFCPLVTGQFDTMSFISLSLNDAGDRLRIFSGTPSSTFTADTSSIPLFNMAGPAFSSSGPTIISNTPGGCLTVHFRSDAAGTAAGWVANIACPPSIPTSWSTVEGDLYVDANSNCIKDNGEAAVAGIPLRLLLGNSIHSTAYTNSNGHYTFYAFDSVYTVTLTSQLANYGFTSSCPAAGHFSILSLPSTGNNFGLQCSSGFDLIAAVNSSPFRPGFNTNISPSVQNFYCPYVNGQAKLVVSHPDVSFISSSVPPDAIIGDTLAWNFSSLNNYQNFGTVTVHTSTTAILGDTVTIKLMVEPDSGDVVPTNNIILFHRIITNSYDPNDKAVTPQGPVLPVSWLTYTVRFQNTGTDTAFNVSVVDTLDANLDLYSFQPLAASHPYDIVMLDSNVVKFVFNNIMLPDSNVNEPLSHGYITYRVKSLAGVPNGTPINNTAHIYFDFNPAVVTNTTVTIIDIPTSVGEHHFALERLTLVPNPATNQVEIRNPKSEIRNIEVYNVLGEKIFSQQLIANSQQHRIAIDVSSLKPGIYFVKVKGEKEESVAKFVKQ